MDNSNSFNDVKEELSDEICRLCTKTNRTLSNIFDTHDNLNCTMSEAVMECAPINLSPDDELPKSICNQCISKLVNAYHFRLLCIDSDIVLRQYKTTLKIKFEENEKSVSNNTLSNLKSDDNGKNDEVYDVELLMKQDNSDNYYIAVEYDETDQPSLLDLENLEKSDDVSIKSDNESSSENIPNETNYKKVPTKPRRRHKIRRTREKRKRICPIDTTESSPPSCKQCKMTFVSHTNLIRHLSTHNGEKKYSCTVCNKKFATPAYVKSHMVVHSKERKYSCDVCGKTFMFSNDLTVHMRKHTGERPYVCETCAKGFVSSSALNAHRFKHGPKRFFCCVCNKGFTYKLELGSHIIVHKKDKFIIYDDNGKITEETSIIDGTSLNDNAANINDGNQEKISVSDLLPGLNNKKERMPIAITRKNYEEFLTEINRLKKTTKNQEYVCDVCNKVLSSCSNLYRHKLIHTGVKPHVCEICNKGFKLKVDLVSHKNRHLGIRTISCEYCPKMFASRSDYGKHVSTHMNHKPYVCDICNKSYYNIYALKYHKKQHMHPFKCTHCSKSYISEEKLAKHIKIHDESKRKFRCELCEKILSNMNSLARHIRKVHNRGDDEIQQQTQNNENYTIQNTK